MRTFRDCLGPDSSLVRNGLLSVDDDLDISMSGCLKRLHWGQDEDTDVRELLLGRSQNTDLAWSDFDHLGEGRDDIESILTGASARRQGRQHPLPRPTGDRQGHVFYKSKQV